MATYLITWNPKRADWTDLAADSRFVQNGGVISQSWSCSNNKSIEIGDQIFLIRLGVQPKGIFASGTVTRGSFEDEHWDEERAAEGDVCRFVEFDIDKLLDPEHDQILSREVLDNPPFDSVNWNTQASGIRIADAVAEELEKLWAEVSNVRKFISPDEANIGSDRFLEGTVHQITVNAFERNTAARKKCIEIHGATCVVCAFDFGKFYGTEMSGYVHVHHLKQLSEVREGYQVNPETDLVPVCPNCHAALHQRNPPYTPIELKEMITRSSVR